MNTRELYTEIILDHFKSPKNYGLLDEPTITLSGGNVHCGDQVAFGIKLKDDLIHDIKFQSKGCAVSRASSSMLTELVKGKSLDIISKLSHENLFEMLGNIIDLRKKCALLPLFVIQSGISVYKNTGSTHISDINF